MVTLGNLAIIIDSLARTMHKYYINDNMTIKKKQDSHKYTNYSYL